MSQWSNHSLKPVAQDTPLSWRHLQLRPTRLGLSLLVIALAVWVGALNYSINLAYMLSFWILAFFIMAYLLTSLQLLGLRGGAHYHGELFVGDEADIVFQFSSLSNRYRAFHVVLDEYRVFIQSDQDVIPDTILALPTTRRGYLVIPNLILISTAPFGLVQAKASLQSTSQILVYPRAEAHPIPSSITNTELEGTANTQKGGDDLSYLNEYQRGESLQHVAWKVFAKQRRLLSKYFESESAHPPDVISYQDYPENTSADRLASFLCYRILEAEKMHQSYSLVLPKGTIPPSRKQRALALSALSML